MILILSSTVQRINNQLGIQKLRVKFRIKDERRNIPIQKLGQQLGGEKCLALLKALVLIRFGITSKIGSKVSAVSSKPDSQLCESYLNDFGIDFSFIFAKKQLMRVISPKSNCKTFDNLRFEMYKMKEKALNELPPLSSTIHEHVAKEPLLCVLMIKPFRNLL